MARSKPRATRSPVIASPPPFLRSHAWLLLAIVVVIGATTDDRHAGIIADGRQMIWTAVAIAETGQLGQARARDLTVTRPAGDGVSRYGLGMSFAQVPAALIAPVVESRFGPSSSQPLFLVAPFLCVLGAAIFSGLAVRELGGGRRAQSLAILFATIASPLGAYAALDLSEPLQAFALAASFHAALVATRPGSRDVRAATFGGAAVALAVFTKSSLIAVAPLTLAPLIVAAGTAAAGPPAATVRLRRVRAASLGFLPVGAAWLLLEYTRFGRPFSSYAGEGFTHSFIDGLWRLTVGVNKGLVWYFPVVVVVIAMLVRAGRPATMPVRERIAVATAFATFSALLVLAAPWWAWSGIDGWGPRLIVPAIPLLAAVAAIHVARWPRAAGIALVAVSIALNAPPLLQNTTPVFNFRLACAWPTASDVVAAGLPRFAVHHDGARTTILPDAILTTIPRATPFVVLPWFWWAAHAPTLDATAARLNSPPWLGARPDIRPDPPITALTAQSFTRSVRWSFWGRGFVIEPEDVGYASAYDSGLADQVLRAQQLRQTDDALSLARKLVALAPSGYADALLIESYRLQGRRTDAAAWLSQLPRDRRSHPAINVVLALFERDAHSDAAARALLQSVVDAFPRSPIETAVRAPLASWPPDFASMTEDPSLVVER